MIDVFTLLSDAQAVTTSAVSTNAYRLSDLATRLRDLGSGSPVRVRFWIGTAFSGGTSIDFQLRLSSASSLTSNVLTLATSGAIVSADLTAGAYFDVGIPAVAATLGDGALRQFFGAYYSVSGTYSQGTVTASLVTDGGLNVRKHTTGYTGP